MTQDERIMYNKAIYVIDYKIILRPNTVSEPSIEQLRAMQLASHAMEARMKETGKDLSKHIAVMNYHLAQPTALLFKDRHTIDAMTAGIFAIKWLMGNRKDEEESVVP